MYFLEESVPMMCSTIQNCNPVRSRFCYSYTPPGVITECCVPVVCATNTYLSSISSLAPIIYNDSRTTEQSLLSYQQKVFLQEVQTSSITSTINYTIQNSTVITSTLNQQLLDLVLTRYLPYQRLPAPCPPPSVIQLQMQTVNVGVPHSFFTMMDCKGSQSVTT
jgi:hypothetical protein